MTNYREIKLSDDEIYNIYVISNTLFQHLTQGLKYVEDKNLSDAISLLNKVDCIVNKFAELSNIERG